MAHLALELQVWYGVLFKPDTALDAECPPLPPWLRKMLDDRGGPAVEKYFIKAGYEGPEPLTWLCYEQPETSYWAMSIEASVQRSTRSVGRVNTMYPDEVAQRWITSIGRALAILGLTARSDWYQTCSYEIATPRS